MANSNPINQKPKEIRTIGVLTNWMREEYHNEMVLGIEEEAKKHNINLLFFLGTTLYYYEEYHKNHHKVYNLSQTKEIDALIIFPGVLDECSPDEIDKFLKPFMSIPIVTLTNKLAQLPCILLDNKTAFRELVEHIIVDHKKNRIAFLKGPEQAIDSLERFEVYKQVLKEEGIPYSDNLVVKYGFLTMQAGSLGIETLINKRQLIPGKDFDAVISVNDMMAIGAINTLDKMGYSVPEDVIVTGFDDIELGQHLKAPLTTIKQPIKSIGKDAIALIMNQNNQADHILIPMQLVVRESCGCKNFQINHKLHLVKEEISETQLKDKQFLLKKLKTSLASEFSENDISSFFPSLSDYLLEFLGTHNSDLFLSQFNDFLHDFSIDPFKINRCHQIISIFRYWIKKISLPQDQKQFFDNVLDAAHSLIGNRIIKLNMKNMSDLRIYLEKYRILEEGIAGSTDLKSLFSTLVHGLTELGFSHYHIFSYNNPDNFSEDFRLLLSCSDSKEQKITESNRTYRNFSEIYEKLLSRENNFNYCVLPMCEHDNIFGFFIINKIKIPYAPSTYEDLSRLLTGSFKGIEQVQQIKDAYQELKITQDELEQEIQVARQIQESLGPSHLQHKEFDIAAKMITAVDVGGDYYDFIPTKKNDWFIIGDVSGHGVRAGLIMMMVQTSIHLMLSQKPDISPRKLLSIVNKGIMSNKNKLEEEKYMTLIVMSYRGKGRFIYSGMHMPLLVYRSKTKEVDIIPTDGMWLGVVENVDDYNKDDSLFLDKGDYLLLYTDGITEAQGKNFQSKFYGDERLIQVFKKAASKSSQHIVDDIINDLNDFELKDDVTLMVIKRH